MGNNLPMASRRTFLGSAVLLGLGMMVAPRTLEEAVGGAFESSIAYADERADEGSGEILLGMFFSEEKDFTDTLYTSLDGVTFEKIAVAYQDLDGPGPGVAYQGTDGCLGNPSIIYYKGMFWACSCWDKGDGTFTLTFGASNDLIHWARPSGAITTLEGGWPTYGNNAVAPEWFVDDDGSVYVVASCGTMGAAHGLDWSADEMYPYLFRATRFDITDSSVLTSSDIRNRYVDSFARIELGQGRRINLPSMGEVDEHDRIDGSLYKEDGVYYLIIKRNGETNEIWQNRNINDCNGWTRVNRDAVGGSEGASMVKWQGTHYLYTDKLEGDWSFKGYGSDLDRGTWWVSAERLWDSWTPPQRILTTPMSMQRKTRHGSVIRITDPAAQQVVWRARQQAGYRVPVSLYGQNFDETAVAESRAAYPNGADAVIIAGQNGWPDALAASGLAGALDCPILITPSGGLSEAIRSEVARLGATAAIVVGGPLAVSDEVASQLGGMGCAVTRLSGWNEFETCHAIYCYGANQRYMSYPGSNSQHDGAVYGEGNIRGRNVWGADVAIVATRMSFADALSASPIAFARKAPLFLTRFAASGAWENRLDDALAGDLAACGASEVLVCGGSGVVPDSTIDQVRSLLPSAEVVRKGGNDAVDTSIQIAQYAVDRWGMGYDGAAFATADPAFGGTDALAGSPVCGKANTVLLLTDQRTIDFINSRSDVSTVRFFGGTAVVSREFRRQVVGGRAQYGL